VDVFHNSDFIKESSGKTHSGEFTAGLKNFGWYIISISAQGYLESTDTLWVMNAKRRTIRKDFSLSPIEVGLTVTLNNILFNFGKTSLSEQSFPELDKVVKLFKENPSVAFEIAGHTDSDGPDDYNLILSQGRAQAVVNYLTGHGVTGSQLMAHGYGETKPIDTSQTKSGKAKNRRVEFKVLTIVPAGGDKQN
jgi:outer membrane protein OmpA-like peptidoglycan-associated protein